MKTINVKFDVGDEVVYFHPNSTKPAVGIIMMAGRDQEGERYRVKLDGDADIMSPVGNFYTHEEWDEHKAKLAEEAAAAQRALAARQEAGS